MSILDQITTGKINRPMRNVIYGVEGVGKSELAAQFDSPIFLCAEDGTAGINTSRYEAKSWGDFTHFIHALTTETDHKYKTINIDSVAWMAELAASYLIEKHDVESLEKIDKGFGKWKRYLFDEFQQVLRMASILYTQGMHVNFIAHATVKPFNNPEGENYDRYTITVNNDAIAQRLTQWADNVLFLNYKTNLEKSDSGFGKVKAKSNTMRMIYAQRTAAYDAKSRMNFPDQMELTPSPAEGYNNLITHYNQFLDAGKA